MSNIKLSILIPTYNRSDLLKETLQSIFKQSFQDYEIVIGDDCSKDNTEEVVKSFHDPRIKYHKNEHNLGYGVNLRACYERSSADLVFLMGHDDYLLKDALLKTYNAISSSEEIGLVTRPYYWFIEGPTKPVRAVHPYNPNQDSILSVWDGKEAIQALYVSAGQLSGLCYKKQYIEHTFHEEIFPAHIYPFSSILRTKKAVYLKDYTIAVRIESSMTRHKPDIYEISPTQSWIKMFDTVYTGEKYKEIRHLCIEVITSRNYDGLVQLKNYATMRILLREIYILAKYRKKNLLTPKFWFYSLLTIMTPRGLLIRLAEYYKKKYLSQQLENIKISL